MDDKLYDLYKIRCIFERKQPMSPEEFVTWWADIPDHQKVEYVRKWRER